MGITGGSVKDVLRGMLKRKDFDAIVELSRTQGSLTRYLLAMTYDRADVISWRAIEAIGRVEALNPPDKLRNHLQRLLWMLREESGNNSWSAGAVIGEVLFCRKAERIEDIVPIVISFHDEPMFRVGALWSLYRVGLVRPDLVEEFSQVPVEYIGDSDPLVRGVAVLAMTGLIRKEYAPHLEAALTDKAEIMGYEGGELSVTTVSALAGRVLRMIA